MIGMIALNFRYLEMNFEKYYLFIRPVLKNHLYSNELVKMTLIEWIRCFGSHRSCHLSS